MRNWTVATEEHFRACPLYATLDAVDEDGEPLACICDDIAEDKRYQWEEKW